MFTLTRILIALGCVVVLSLLYGWFFGVQTLVGFEARSLSHQQPQVNTELVPLRDLSVPDGPSVSFSASGYKFDLPWNDPDLKHLEPVADNRLAIPFQNGHSLFLTSEPPNQIIDTMIAKQQTTREGLGQVYGEEAVRSDYDFEKAILSATPDKVSRHNTKMQAFQLGMQLLMKTAIVPHPCGSQFFMLKTDEFRGFQYGRPEDHLNDLEVELYSGDVRIDIHFNRDTGSAAPITQAEINRFVQSLHKTPEEEPGTEPTRP
jgi:hypothetical protein